ncbi:hypothetical protein D2E25_1208 [Bifidobacterium goeldii]|uniref:Uncharacterized protein n=1 Tax=Bifidobacterium goeldii TaxID=2306975 RepID=A0A430FK04_9BIFI|nr:hypothetical protein D2E25_1208 [Bifidobacterium goeldii]
MHVNRQGRLNPFNKAMEELRRSTTETATEKKIPGVS